MRILAFIFSLYIVWLTTIPCIDVAGDHSAQKTELISRQQDQHHHSDADHCSPFCTCNCCQTTIELADVMMLTPVSGYTFHYYEITPDFQSPELFDFLIPPKA